MSEGQGLRDFVSHVHALKAVDSKSGYNGFQREFLILKVQSREIAEDRQYSTLVGKHPNNTKKNRYKDIVPYDHARCILPPIEGEDNSDYINASYIKGTSEQCSVIATQGPLTSTMFDFWRMIWTHRTQVIVMTCRVVEAGKKKCAKYWPEVGQSVVHGNILVKNLACEEFFGDFVINNFVVECNGESRQITHFHYGTWPDHGVPRSPVSVMYMLKKVREAQPDDAVPIVVHCSAGCGRTGTITAIDYLWTLLKKNGLDASFNVYETVARLRQQRFAMVQTSDQYLFVYKAVLDLVKNILQGVTEGDSDPSGDDVRVAPQVIPTEEPLYVNLKPYRTQAESLSVARKEVLKQLEVPEMTDEITATHEDNDEESEEVPIAQRDAQDPGFQRIEVKDFGDLSFPNRPPKPWGPRPAPESWPAYRKE